MSNIVQGQAPIVNFLNITHAFSDVDAVNHLFNNTSATSYGNYTNESHNMTGLYLSTSTNKSLYVFQQSNISSGVTNITSVNISTTNSAITDMFALNVTASQVLRGDDLRFKITTADSGDVNEPNNNLKLSEVAPTSQNDATALNDLRILNKSSVMATSPGTSVVYNTTNLQNALGVEGKAYYYTSTQNSFAPNYKAISNYDSMANNNIVLSIDNLTANNEYNYEVVKVATGDASFNFSSTQSGSSDVCIMKNGQTSAILGEYLTSDLGVSPDIFYSYRGNSLGGIQSGSDWSIVGSNDYSTWHLIDSRVNSGFPGNPTIFTNMNGPYAGIAYRYVRIIFQKTQNSPTLYLKMTLRMLNGNQIGAVLYKDHTAGLSSGGNFNGWSMNDAMGFCNNIVYVNRDYTGSVSTTVNLSPASLTSVDSNSTQTYVGFVGSNDYTGLLGVTGMNKVYSSSLVINLSNDTNVTQALSGGNVNLIVDPTFVSIPNLTLSQVNDIDFADFMNITLTPVQVTLSSDANLPSPNPLNITQASESLPAGHTLDNATLSFNSADRSTVTTNSYNLSTEVIYAVDNISGSSNLTLANMQALSVVRELSVMQPATPANPITGNWTNSQGLNVFYDENVTTGKVNIQNVTNPNGVSFIGMVEQVETGYFMVNTGNNYTGSVLLAEDAGVNNFSLTVSSNYGNTSGANITGEFRLGYFTNVTLPNRPLSDSDMRVRLIGNDPLDNATFSHNATALTVTGLGIRAVNNSTNGYVTFNSNATFGAVSYKDFPNTDGYEQRYTLQFPTAGEVSNFDVYPESILLEGFNSNNVKLSNSMSNATMSIPLGFDNWRSKTSSTTVVNGIYITTLSYTIEIDLSLSGVKNVKLLIPISYQYNSGAKQWIDGVPPALSVSIMFDTNQLTTHNIIIAAKKGTEYVNINASDLQEKIDLRRGPYDAIVLNSGIQYGAVVSIYPEFEQDFYNIDYYIPITKKEDTTGGLKAAYYRIDNDQNLINTIAGYDYKGLNQSRLVSLCESYKEMDIQMNITLLPGVGYPERYLIADGDLSFIYLAQEFYDQKTLYFVYIQNSIVKVDSPTAYNFMMSNDTRYLLQGTDGVYVTSTNINGPSSASLVASISLNKDKYSAQVYGGSGGVVANDVSILDNGVLINGSTYSSFGLSTNIVRGFKNGSSYTFSRGELDYEATYGSYTQTGTLTPAGSSPTNLILNFGEGLGFSVNLVSNPTAEVEIEFTVNKTSASAVYKGVTYYARASTSVKLTDMIDVGTAVPWIEMLALNNIFHPTPETATIQLVQPDIVVSTSSTYEYGVNNTLDALSVLNGFTYSPKQTVSDNDLVTTANYQINRDQVHLLYNANKMLRPVGKTYYVTVAPVDVRIAHFVNPASLNIGYVKLTQALPIAYNVTVNGQSAKYNLNLNNELKVSSLKSSPPAASNFNYKSNLFTFQGKIIDAPTNWYEYFANLDITVPVTLSTGTIGYNSQYGYTFTFPQYNNDIAHEIVVYWTNVFNRPIYNNDGSNYAFSPNLRIIPSTRSQFTQYQLGFVLNSNNVLIPQVRKYVSSLYDSILDHTTEPNGFVQNIDTLSGSLLNLVDPTSVLDLPRQLPYKYGTSGQSHYPEANNKNVSIASTVPINLTGSNLKMDLVLQVKDSSPNVSGSVAYNKYIGDILSGDNNRRKILNVFARDQLVIQDYAKNLSLRVGPNGRMYAGDISSYSLNLNDNLASSTGPVNGNYVPIYNSDVNLV
jgi:hypothetical protein